MLVLGIISMFYPEDQYVDMLRVENEYISELLKYEEYFWLDDTDYLKEGIKKMEQYLPIWKLTQD